MPRLISVFDSNVYRSLGDRRLEELRMLERSHGVIGCPSYQVVQELLAHLASRDDPDFWPAHAALQRLGLHCRRFNGQRYALRFVPDALDQVAMLILGRPLSDSVLSDQYAGLVGAVADGEVAADPDAFAAMLAEVAEIVATHRSMFTDGVRAMVQTLQEGELASAFADKSRRRDLRAAFGSDAVLVPAAYTLLRAVTDEAGILVDDEVAPEYLARIIHAFPTPLRCFNAIVRGVAMDGRTLEAQDSIAFDLRISFVATGRAQLDGLPVRLVTDDGLIHDAATAAGAPAAVFRVDKYRTWLEDGGPSE